MRSFPCNQWTALTRFCDDGALAIDNNATERALRGIAIGRRNWMFVGSDVGGQTAATLLSFVATCRLADVDSFTWFRDVLTRIAQGHPVKSPRRTAPSLLEAASGLVSPIHPFPFVCLGILSRLHIGSGS